ncbi:MAG: 30S ribosomal protein S27ae [Candidatus Woesearchaeota archaeon]
MADNKDKGKEAKGGKSNSNKSTTQSWKKYVVSGDSIKLKNKTCPKCGSSFLMAQHKDRITCGKCHYTEFSAKDVEKELKEADKSVK